MVPVSVSGIAGVTALTAGYLHACATVSDGSARCWGYNGAGVIGDGTMTNRSTPTAVALSGVRFTSLAAGYQQTCGLTDGGRLYCWGSSSWGSVGNGSTSGALYPTPQLLAPTSVASVTTGPMAAHTCAVRADGVRLCWGWNNAGQVGDGATTNLAAPRDIAWSETRPVALAAGFRHTCALRQGR